MSDYGAGYFEARQRDEDLRATMRAQEVARLRHRTGLDGGTVVDVGCGLGELLDHFPPDRWRRFGTEAAVSARAACEAKGIAFDLPEVEGWCDLVLMRGVLQHLDRPVRALADARSWLRPGGWLVLLQTPNAGGPVYRLFQELPALDPPRNFVVFSDRELRQCLVNLGFRTVEIAYPYLGTPYAHPVRDHLRFALRLVGVRRPFAFWRSMMECCAQA